MFYRYDLYKELLISEMVREPGPALHSTGFSGVRDLMRGDRTTETKTHKRFTSLSNS